MANGQFGAEICSKPCSHRNHKSKFKSFFREVHPQPTPKNILSDGEGVILKKSNLEGWGEGGKLQFLGGGVILCNFEGMHDSGGLKKQYRRDAPKIKYWLTRNYLCTIGGESRRFYLLRWRVGLARSIYVVSNARACQLSGGHVRGQVYMHRDRYACGG